MGRLPILYPTIARFHASTSPCKRTRNVLIRSLWCPLLFVLLLPVDCFSQSIDTTGNSPSIVHEEQGGMRKVHISWGYALRMGGPARAMKRVMENSGYDGSELSILSLFGFPSPEYPSRHHTGVTLNAGVDLDIMPGWRSGINYSKNTGLVILGMLKASETAGRRSWEFTMSRVGQLYKKSNTSRSAWGLAMGVSINKLTVHARVPIYQAQSGEPLPNLFHEQNYSKTKPGLVMRYTYDSYLGKFFSVHFGVDARFIGRMKVGATGRTLPLKAHRLNFSSLDPNFGIRFHL